MQGTMYAALFGAVVGGILGGLFTYLVEKLWGNKFSEKGKKIVILICVIVGFSVIKNLSNFEEKNGGALEKTLIQAASKINANCPIMVDSETRLDSVSGINRGFQYNYTLVKYSANEIEPVAIKNAMLTALINNLCTSKGMKIFVKNNVPVTYAYFGKNGKKITTITVSPSQCKSSYQ